MTTTALDLWRKRLRDVVNSRPKQAMFSEVAAILREEADVLSSPDGEYLTKWAKVAHASDCAVHNMPAYPNGPCDCRTPEYTAEQVAEVVEGLNAIITEPAECWQPTHISRDDIRTVLAEIKRLTLQVESAEADTKRLDDAQTLFIGADFAWGDPEHPRPVVVLQIPEHVRVGVDFRKFLDAARNREGGND